MNISWNERSMTNFVDVIGGEECEQMYDDFVEVVLAVFHNGDLVKRYDLRCVLFR